MTDSVRVSLFFFFSVVGIVMDVSGTRNMPGVLFLSNVKDTRWVCNISNLHAQKSVHMSNFSSDVYLHYMYVFTFSVPVTPSVSVALRLRPTSFNYRRIWKCMVSAITLNSFSSMPGFTRESFQLISCWNFGLIFGLSLGVSSGSSHWNAYWQYNAIARDGEEIRIQR